MRPIMEKILALTMTQVLILSGILGALYFYFLYDNGAVIEARIAALVQEQSVEGEKKKETEIALREEKRIKEIVGTLGSQYQEVSKKLPNQLTSFDMNRQVTVFSQAARAKVKSMTPQAPIKKEIVDEVPVRVVIDDSTYADIALFVYQASISERLIRVRDFSIQPGTGGIGKLKFEGTIVGYRLNIEEPKKEGGINTTKDSPAPAKGGH